MKTFFQSRNDTFFTIKMDELAVTPRVRWNSKNNELVGTCFNHKEFQSSYEFKNELNLHQLKNNLKSNKLHLAKESLLVTLSAITNNSDDKIPKILCNMPLCSHKNGNVIKDIINEIDSTFERLNPNSNIVNVATNGDPYRRNILNQMREENKDLNELKHLPHFHQQFLLGKYGINFDPKHVIKRIRSAIIGNKSFQLNKLSISKDTIRYVLLNSKKEDVSTINHLMDIKDKQNVSSAVKLLNLLHSVSQDAFMIKNPIEKDQMCEIQLYSTLCQLFLTLFVDTTIDLSQQLINLAQLAHCLFYVYRRSKLNSFHFMRKDLYMDIQSIIQDAFISCAIFRKRHSDKQLYLFQLGTDQLETYFQHYVL